MLTAACKENVIENKVVKPKFISAVYIQTFHDQLSAQEINTVYLELKKIFKLVYLLPKKDLPRSAYSKQYGRYRADSLLRIIDRATATNCKTIALTSVDISTTKKDKADFGVMGLGYTPGKACVVSTFRLNKRYMLNQLYKVAIHELGHTFGLPHCPINTCYMRDAKGGNPLNEEVDFSPNCKKYLVDRGWKL